jgi:hypothetical protein
MKSPADEAQEVLERTWRLLADVRALVPRLTEPAADGNLAARAERELYARIVAAVRPGSTARWPMSSWSSGPSRPRSNGRPRRGSGVD